jgi:hypothetical protein
MAAEVSAVTPDLVDLLEGGVSIFVGTSDAERRPEATRAVGALVSPDRTKVTVFVPVATAQRAVENLAHRREIAVGFSRTLDHVSIQIKGAAAEVRLATDAERSICERYLGAYVEALHVIGLPRSLTRRMTVWPAYALEVEVRDVFAQTPGPGAGNRLEAKS